MKFKVYSNKRNEGWHTRFAWFPRWCGDREDTGYGYSYSYETGTIVWFEKYRHYWNGSSWSSSKRTPIEEIYDPNQ